MCEPICGDSVVLWNETCDDGNTISWDWCDNICQKESTWCDSQKIDSCISNNCSNLWWSDYDSCNQNCTNDCRYTNPTDVSICVHKIVSGWKLIPEDFDLYINQKQFTSKICTYWPNAMVTKKCGKSEELEKVWKYTYGVTINNIYYSFSAIVDSNFAWSEIEKVLNNLSISYSSVSSQWTVIWIESGNIVNSINIWISDCLVNEPDPNSIKQTVSVYNEYCEWIDKKYITVNEWKWPVVCKNISKESYISWEVLVWEKLNSDYDSYFSGDCWKNGNITNYWALSSTLNCYITNVLKCGNWAINKWETCDDGNTISWDWCDNICQVENICSPNSWSSCGTWTGVCIWSGVILCDWSCSTVAKTWSTEICNNLDDNCNWQIDEWLTCTTWTGNGWWPICSPNS